MRADGTFIAVEVDEAIVKDPEIANRLADACPVDIYGDAQGEVQIVEENLDECVLCGLCLEVSPDSVHVMKLYDDAAELTLG